MGTTFIDRSCIKNRSITSANVSSGEPSRCGSQWRLVLSNRSWLTCTQLPPTRWSRGTPVGINLASLETISARFCDASGLLFNAANVGDCSSVLPSRTSCTNNANAGHYCSSSNCNNGVLTIGSCFAIGNLFFDHPFKNIFIVISSL